MTRLERFRLYQRISRGLLVQAAKYHVHVLRIVRSALKHQRFAWSSLVRRTPGGAP